MPYTVTSTALPDVLILEPTVFGDDRGFFFESFNQRAFAEATGIDQPFVQDNHSKSSRGVLRGLHYQIAHPQGKLVRVTAAPFLTSPSICAAALPRLPNGLGSRYRQKISVNFGCHQGLHMAL